MEPIWREFRSIFLSPVVAVSCAVVIVLSTIAGPFGTYNVLSLSDRFLYWLLATTLFAALFVGSRCLVRKVLPRAAYWEGAAVASAIMAVLLVILIHQISNLFDATLVKQFPPSVVLIALAFLLSGAIYWLLLAAQRRLSADIRLMQRVPEELRGKLLRLSVDDHTVLIYTDKGCHRVLMRLSDAKVEAEGADGFCIHRSHWVVRSAIVSARKEKGRVFVTLTDGSEAPVSRTYQHRIEEGGWL